MAAKPDDTANLRQSSKIGLDEKWIDSRTDEELADLIARLATKLRARLVHETVTVAAAPAEAAFDDSDVSAVKQFTRLPPVSDVAPQEIASTAWRIILVAQTPLHEPIGIEVYDRIIIGRWSAGSRPQLDLNNYGGDELGVSRRHAALTPSKDSLLLSDLGSTNGTLVNGVKLAAGGSQELKDGDVLSFGGLNFMLKILSKPG